MPTLRDQPHNGVAKPGRHRGLETDPFHPLVHTARFSEEDHRKNCSCAMIFWFYCSVDLSSIAGNEFKDIMMIVSLYAAILAILFVILSIRVIRLRRQLQIGLGDSGDKNLLRAISVHSNFSEYAPLSLFLIFLVESQAGYSWFVHSLGICLLVGRLSHAYGVSQSVENYNFRVFGMAMTFTSIILSSVFLLVSYTRNAIA